MRSCLLAMIIVVQAFLSIDGVLLSNDQPLKGDEEGFERQEECSRAVALPSAPTEEDSFIEALAVVANKPSKEGGFISEDGLGDTNFDLGLTSREELANLLLVCRELERRLQARDPAQSESMNVNLSTERDGYVTGLEGLLVVLLEVLTSGMLFVCTATIFVHSKILDKHFLLRILQVTGFSKWYRKFLYGLTEKKGKRDAGRVREKTQIVTESKERAGFKHQEVDYETDSSITGSEHSTRLRREKVKRLWSKLRIGIRSGLLIQKVPTKERNRRAQYSNKRCYVCNRERLFFKHLCGKCNRVVCAKHTAFKNHSSIYSCDVYSKCRCVSCYEEEQRFYKT